MPYEFVPRVFGFLTCNAVLAPSDSVHLTDERWHCNCSQPHTPYDFEGKLTRAFSELLRSDAPNLCDAHAGLSVQRAGDGMLSMPTLVHRGPGLASDATEDRMVLFLTLRPVYRNLRGRGIDEIHHKYNPALQIHASCILYNQVRGWGRGRGGVDLIVEPGRTVP